MPKDEFSEPIDVTDMLWKGCCRRSYSRGALLNSATTSIFPTMCRLNPFKFYRRNPEFRVQATAGNRCSQGSVHQFKTTILPPALFSSIQRWASTI